MKGVDFDDSDDEGINFIFVNNGLDAKSVQLLSEQQKKYASIPTTWVLLDSQSTMESSAIHVLCRTSARQATG